MNLSAPWEAIPITDYIYLNCVCFKVFSCLTHRNPIEMFLSQISSRLFSRPRYSYLIALAASLGISFFYHPIWQIIHSTITEIMSESHHTVTPARTPVYFLGIGGPNFMENTNHPAYTQLAVVGKEITTKVKPKAVVVISAHWQASPDTIHINADENPGIIYDFYGFPKH